MENIIKDILKIEVNAQKRLAEAEQQSVKIIAAAMMRKEELINSKIQEAKEKISAINEDEKNKAEIEIIRIEQNKSKEIKHIDEIYILKHTEWEENIFNQIING